jgi:hypothetical protein
MLDMMKLHRKRVAVGLILFASTMISVSMLMKSPSSQPHSSIASAPHNTGFVTGKLGNTPVNIPHVYAQLVEYNRDPKMIEGNKNTYPKNYASRIRSFGFKTHLPDMTGTIEQKLKRKESDDINTSNWLEVSVVSNEYYGTNDNMEREVNSLITGEFNRFTFIKLPETPLGMETYYPGSADKKHRRRTGIVDMQDYNIYVNRDERGFADTYITCINTEYASAPCSMRYLLPDPMKSRVTIRFRVGMLKSWKDIRNSTTNLIKSFAVQAIK